MKQKQHENNAFYPTSRSLRIYSSELNKIKALPIEMEQELALKIKGGDMDALYELTNANLKFVYYTAIKFCHRGVELDDLIAEGNIAMLKAAKKFDATLGYKFISYAVWPIKQAIMYTVTNQASQVRLPQFMIANLSLIKKANNHLRQMLFREPTYGEIAEYMKADEHWVKECLGYQKSTSSIYENIYGESGINILDTMMSDLPMPDCSFEAASLSHEANNTLSILSTRERVLINEFYGIGIVQKLNYDQLAARHHLTKERVRQIIKAALLKLTENKSVRSYLKQRMML